VPRWTTITPNATTTPNASAPSHPRLIPTLG
jgi:hypothetical protein